MGSNSSFRVKHTVDGRNPAKKNDMVKYPHDLQGFIHVRWFLGISETINTIGKFQCALSQVRLKIDLCLFFVPTTGSKTNNKKQGLI